MTAARRGSSSGSWGPAFSVFTSSRSDPYVRAARSKRNRKSWSAALATATSVLAIIACANAQSLETVCYHKVGNKEEPSSPGGGPCGIVTPDTGFLSCCAVGDQCVEGGLCHFTHPPNPQWNQSGYYVGGCTDSTLADPHCNLGCGSFPTLDIVYDTKSQQWRCCGSDDDGDVTCNDPSTQTAPGKHIADLATTYVVPTGVITGSATSTPSSSSSVGATSTTDTAASESNTATSAPDSQKSSGGGTSHTGAIAGGVIGGVAFVALVAGAAWFWYRKRSGSSSAADLAPDARYELGGAQGYYAPLGKEQVRDGRAELGTSATNATEMEAKNLRGSDTNAAELP